MKSNKPDAKKKRLRQTAVSLLITSASNALNVLFHCIIIRHECLAEVQHSVAL